MLRIYVGYVIQNYIIIISLKKLLSIYMRERKKMVRCKICKKLIIKLYERQLGEAGAERPADNQRLQ
jgi:hypothetical protein